MEARRAIRTGVPEKPAGPARASLAVLFFLQAAAMAAYTLPFANVLRLYGLGEFIVFAFCAGGVAAFISPMIVGSLADRSFPAERLLAGLSLSSAALLALVFWSVENRWGPGWFFVFMGAFALCNSPSFGLITSIVLARLSDPRREFGPLRVWATWGWMIASFGVSWVLRADHSPRSGYGAACVLLILGIFSLFLTPTPPVVSGRTPRRIRDFFGWEALGLLKHPDHRLIFLTSAVFSALLSTFYRYSPPHLTDNGVRYPSAVMGTAQVAEGVAMFALAGLLLRFRLKWVLLAGLLLGVLRLALMATDANRWMYLSVLLHGPVFVLFYPASQIYLEQRVDVRLRTQGQSLLTLLNSGVGNLSGYLLIELWHRHCTAGGETDWTRFWALPAAVCALLAACFAVFYEGRNRRFPTPDQ